MNAQTSCVAAETVLTEREQWQAWFAEERAVFVDRYPRARAAEADTVASAFANLMMFNAKRRGRVFARPVVTVDLTKGVTHG